MQKALFRKTILILNLMLLSAMSVYGTEPSQLDKAAENAKKFTEALSIRKIFDALTLNLSDALRALSLSFGISAAVILISGVFKLFERRFSAYTEIFGTVASSILILCCLSALNKCFTIVEQSLSRICSHMISFIPTAAALLASSGNTITSGLGAFSSSFYIGALQLISSSLILPLIKAICVLTCADLLCRQVKLLGITSFLKTACLWIIGLSFTVLTGILSLQTVLSSGADKLALKGIRYSAAKLIPVAGGMISESLKTVIASMTYIKSVTGVGVLVFMVYTVITPLCAILALKIFFSIMSALAKITELSTAVALFDVLSVGTNILAALLAECFVSFTVFVGIFIKVAVSL